MNYGESVRKKMEATWLAKQESAVKKRIDRCLEEGTTATVFGCEGSEEHIAQFRDLLENKLGLYIHATNEYERGEGFEHFFYIDLLGEPKE